MKTYTVHLYRDIRMTFKNIEACSPAAALSIARDGDISDADDVEDSGKDLAAVIDMDGDADSSRSVTIDFEAERQRKAAPKLLAALKLCHEQLSLWVADTETCGLSPEDEEALAKAADSIAEAESAGTAPEPAEADVRAVLAMRGQIADAALRQICEAAEEYDEMGRDFPLQQLLNILHDAAHAAGNPPLANAPTIRIEVRGGGVLEVSNVPPGWKYQIVDYDDLDGGEADAAEEA